MASQIRFNRPKSKWANFCGHCIVPFILPNFFIVQLSDQRMFYLWFRRAFKFMKNAVWLLIKSFFYIWNEMKLMRGTDTSKYVGKNERTKTQQFKKKSHLKYVPFILYAPRSKLLYKFLAVATRSALIY